jgi:hypothetical protein
VRLRANRPGFEATSTNSLHATPIDSKPTHADGNLNKNIRSI